VSAILNPVDVIKTRRQLSPAHVTASILVRQVVQTDGIFGLWTPGLRATVVREVLYSGCAKGLYPYARRAVAGDNPDPSLLARAAAASLTGFGGSVLANAADVVKIQQFAATTSHNQSLLATVTEMIRREGIIAGLLLRGVSASAPRGAAIAIGEITTYDYTKSRLRSIFPPVAQNRDPFVVHVLASIVTGVVATTVAAPFDIIKSRTMASKDVQSHAGSILRELLQADGALALLRGWWPAYLRLAPHAVMTFPLLEQMRRALGLDDF